MRMSGLIALLPQNTSGQILLLIHFNVTLLTPSAMPGETEMIK